MKRLRLFILSTATLFSVALFTVWTNTTTEDTLVAYDWSAAENGKHDDSTLPHREVEQGAAVSVTVGTPTATASSFSKTNSKTMDFKKGAVNPHIVTVAGESPGEAVNFMRQQCAAHLPMLHTDEWVQKRGIPTKYNKQTYFFQSGLVCYDKHANWYYDPPAAGGDGSAAPRPRSFQEPFNRREFVLKDSAVLHPMTGNKTFFGRLTDSMAAKKFFFHRSLGILSSGNWGTVSIYHFSQDLLMGMLSLILSNPELETLPRDTIQMHENHIAKQEKWRLMPCYECLAVAPIVTDNFHQPNVTISYLGSVDDSMRCFCGLAFVHHQTLSNRAACCSKPMLNHSHVSDIMIEMKTRLVKKWALRPYGEPVEYRDYSQYGYWPNATNPRQPRLLFLLRTKSRYIGRKEQLMEAARIVGFHVHAMAFESESMERQMAAGRYADVVLGTHGAALTSLMMMDTTDVMCRSLIEMFHWAPLGRIVHYQKMAYMTNVTALGVQPIDVLFGKTVPNPAKERKKLKSFSYTWDGNGFHDQTAFYDVVSVRDRLMEAMKNLKRCRGLELPERFRDA